ncbi:MAG: DUF362 domain-containing protein [Anaerolineales bacterium]|jgi:uncharacterized protein (DUF362 family)|nr:DUF362 domain-containing protein [Anaerolineales bacterium]
MNEIPSPQANSIVVISRLPEGLNLQQDYVALPRNYGSPAYFARPDIQAIRRLVEENLAALDERLGFTHKITGKRVILKPNLVTVYHRMGTIQPDYPETTDPRLLDAVAAYFRRFTNRLAIVESSGRGIPTRGSFAVSGIDRLARYHGAELIALEEQPVRRYLVPGAGVQKMILVPEIFSEVIEGQAFYISIPKLKTNLYTGVTLGFKNAMGILPYNLRQRQHHFALDQKLVDIMHLVKPDLTLIDGLVGGEGNCPAPVDPVDSRVIISGNNCVETDRVAARIMGFDPSSLPLICAADAAGFNDPQVEITGEQFTFPFRPADPSLLSETFHQQFPNVRALVGHDLPHAPRVPNRLACTPALANEMEMTCRGGCLASTRFAFEMLVREGQRCDFEMVVLIGAGFELEGERCYLDHTGRAYTLAEIRQLPGKKLAIGSCTRTVSVLADRFVEGCMPFPNAPHAALHHLTGTWCRVMSLKNKHLLPMLMATLRTSQKRKRMLRAGFPLDCALPSSYLPEQELRVLAPEEQELRAVRWDLPQMSQEEIRAAVAAENRAVMATFTGNSAKSRR